MSSHESNDNKRVLYLERIEIEAALKKGFRLKLRIGNRDVEIHQEKGSSTWLPARGQELESGSDVTLTVKAGYKLGGVSLGAHEALVKFSGQEAMDAFWKSTDWITRATTFDHQPVTITFKFRPSPTSETTRAAVQELESTMETYRILMKDSTEQTIDLVFKHGAKLAEGSLPFFSPFPATYTLQVNPIVSTVFGIANGVFEFLKEQKQYDGMVSSLAEGIGRICGFATLALDDIVCDETELLDRAVRKMCTLIADATNFICSYAKQRPGVRAIKSVTTNTRMKIKALQEDFVKLKEDFDRAVHVETLRSVRETEESRLLDRLNPIAGASYQKDRACMEGTRVEVLDDAVAWALRPDTQPSGSNAENIYWLYGSPGLGKTSIANSLCERLHRTGNLGGSFFCKRDDPILRQPKRVLPTLISKLAEMWSPYRKLVAQALQDGPQLNPDSAGGETLLKLLKSVQRHPPHTFVLVIDALDECGESGTRKPLLNSLLEACFQVDWLKVIVTSRPEHDIETFFKKHLVTSRNLATDDPARKDITLFTRKSMALVAKSCNLTDWPAEKQLKQIVQRSGGLFIFVETLRRFLDQPDQLDPESLLAQVLEGDLKEANAELYTLYSTIITTRVGSYKDTFRVVAQAIVVVAKYRPLCDITLAYLLGLKSPVVKTLVDRLSPLLYRDQSGKDGVRVHHLSVTEFLTGPSCPSEFRVDLRQADAELSIRCLVTMTQELKFNICDLKTSLLANAEIQGLDKVVDEKIPDGLQYSCMHWSGHLCSNSDPASAEVSLLLDEFLTGPRPLFWIEVLSLMGKAPVAISALRQIKSCTKKFQDGHWELVDEILRFSIAFLTPISTSTPHLYISGLAFTPTESKLWKNASSSFPNVMSVCKGRMQSWPTLPGVWLGHTWTVYCVTYSRDGRYVVSGSYDKMIRIWDAETGEAVGEPLRGHTGWIYSVAYSPDGRRILSGSSDETIRIWDAETGEAVGEPLRGHTGPIYSVAYSPDGRRILSGSEDATIRIWDAETREAVCEPLRGHTDYIRSVAYSPDGRRVASSSSDKTIRIWDAGTGEAVGEPLVGHADYIRGVAYSPDGRRILSGSDDETIRIWDAETGEAVGEPLRGHTGWIYSVAYSPDGRRILSGSHDKTIRIWDAETGEAVGEPLRGHTGYIYSVAYSPDGRRILSGSDDETIRIWDAETREAVGEPLRGHTGWIYSVAYSPDGRRILSGSHDKTIRIWDAETGEAVGEPLRGHTGYIYSVAYSPDGRRILSGSSDKTIRIWDAETGEAVGEPLMGHTYYIRSVAYSPDGRRILSGSYDKTIRIWDAETGEAVGEPLMDHWDYICSVAYSPDGRRILSGSEDATIRIWDAETGEAVGEPLRDHAGPVLSVAYSPDGRRILSGYFDKTIRIWDAETGEAVGEPLRGHTGPIYSVAYSPDGRRILSGSEDATIRIWDAETGEAVGEPLSGHTGYIYSVAYSPDGRRILSGSSDATIRIWDADTAEAVGDPLKGHDGTIFSVAYSPDGRDLVSGSADQTIRIWDAESRVTSGGHRNVLDSSHLSTGFSDARSLVSTHRPSLAALSGAITPDMLDPQGYVRTAKGLLFWVPEDCRNGITSPAIMAIPHWNSSRHRPVRVDLTNFQYGTSWTNIYEGA